MKMNESSITEKHLLIPMKSITRKYISVKYGVTECWDVTWRSPEGMMLYALLQGKRKASGRPLEREGERMLVRLVQNHGQTKRYILSIEARDRFENFIHSQIIHDALLFIEASLSSGTTTIQDSIAEFIYKFDFNDEEITLESIRRHYQRKIISTQSKVA